MGGGVKKFTPTVFPAHPSQMPVLTNNVNLQGREDRPPPEWNASSPYPEGTGMAGVDFFLCPHAMNRLHESPLSIQRLCMIKNTLLRTLLHHMNLTP